MKLLAHRQATLFYDWDGRPAFYGSYLINVLKRYQRIKQDPRATNFQLRYGGQMFDPDTVKVKG